MGGTATTQTGHVIVSISKDRLLAVARVRPEAPRDQITEEAVLSAITNSSIPINDDVRARVAEFVKLATGDEPPQEVFPIAQGRPPKEAVDEEFVWDPGYQQDADDWQGDAPVNYYTFNSIVTVDADAVIGSIRPAQPARPGVDVFGQPIPSNSQPVPIELADSIRRDDADPSRLIARTAGRIAWRRPRLSIDEVLRVDGDVDFETGHIDSVTDVYIQGTVHDRFEVRSRKGITIGGAIEAALVKAAGDVVVRGGVLAREVGSVESGGDIVTKFTQEATLKAKGDIKITKEMMNSDVHSEGKLVGEFASLIGGVLYARQAVHLAVAGSDANVKTRIAVGIHPFILQEAAELEESVKPKLKAIERIRSTVQPLMDNLKRLTPTQKEQATELLFKADEAEMEVNEIREAREGLLEAARAPAPPQVVIAKILHPGVTISIGTRITTIHKEIKGPVSLEVRKVKNVTEFVVVNQLTGSIHVLPCEKSRYDRLVEGFDAKQREVLIEAARSKADAGS